MTAQTPAETLDALEAAIAKATPGEWEVDVSAMQYDMMIRSDDSTRIAIMDCISGPEPYEQDGHNAAAIVALHNAAPSLIADARALVEARALWQDAVDDHMTSENHHPDYVLIPKATFDAARAALVTR